MIGVEGVKGESRDRKQLRGGKGVKESKYGKTRPDRFVFKG